MRAMKRNRLTIMLDPELEKKIRLRQAKLIHDSFKSVSFSYALEEVVRAGLKNGKA